MELVEKIKKIVRGTASQFHINQVAEMGQAAKVFQWLSLVQFLPVFLSG